MNRKKITAIAACLIMALSLTACGSQTSQPGQEGQSSQPAQNTQTADSSSELNRICLTKKIRYSPKTRSCGKRCLALWTKMSRTAT